MDMEDMMGMDPKEYRLTGWIFLIMGFIGIIFPYFISAFAVYMTGFMLIIGGFAFAFSGERSGWIRWLMALVFFALGLLVIVNPYESILALGILMGIFFLITGFAALFMGFVNLKEGGALMLFNGIISLILAGMVIVGWPEDTAWMVGVFLGVYLLFEGVALLMMGKYADMNGGVAAA